MSDKKAPNCLHIPPLYAGATLPVIWEGGEDASYEVDCVFDQSFEQADTGLSWEDLDARGAAWEAEEWNSWDELEQTAAQGLCWRECPILYIYSTNIRTEYFKRAV